MTHVPLMLLDFSRTDSLNVNASRVLSQFEQRHFNKQSAVSNNLRSISPFSDCQLPLNN